MATTYTWTNTSSNGDTWSTAADWSGGIPAAGAGNIALFSLAGSYSTSISSLVNLGATGVTFGALATGATIAINSTGTLQSTQTLAMAAGTITLTNGALQIQQFNLNGGVIKGTGSIDARAASTAVAHTITLNGGTIIASGGTLSIGQGQSVTLATGTLQIDSNSKLLWGQNNAVVSGGFNFLGTGGTLQVGYSGASPWTNFFTAAGGGVYNSSGIVTGLNVDNTNNGVGSTTNRIELNSVASVTSAMVNSGSILQVVTNLGTLNITTNGNFTGNYVNWAADAAGGFDFWVDTQVCYAAGTRVLTDRGERAVEDIAEGDIVITLQDGQAVPQPVKWVGYRHLDLTTHRKPETAAPIRISRGAFGENLPHRDLVVSPDHGLFVDGKLIPAKLLVNGMTVVQELQAKSVTYYHVELEQHAILVAEGMAAESYLDTGNRGFFANAGLALVLHPEFEVNANLRCWEEDACAPLAVSPDLVGPVWQQLAERALTLGYATEAVEQTDDPGLHLLADGRLVRPMAVDGGRYTFVLPAGAGDLRIASRATLPSDLTPYNGDGRVLGVAISRIAVRSGTDMYDIPLDHPALAQGWHKVEREDGRMWRWTNGNALLPISGGRGRMVIEVQAQPLSAYRLAETQRLAA